ANRSSSNAASGAANSTSSKPSVPIGFNCFSLIECLCKPFPALASLYAIPPHFGPRIGPVCLQTLLQRPAARTLAQAAVAGSLANVDNATARCFASAPDMAQRRRRDLRSCSHRAARRRDAGISLAGEHRTRRARRTVLVLRGVGTPDYR